MLKMKAVTDIVIRFNRNNILFTGIKYSNITRNVVWIKNIKKTYLDQCDYSVIGRMNYDQMNILLNYYKLKLPDPSV